MQVALNSYDIYPFGSNKKGLLYANQHSATMVGYYATQTVA